MVYAELYDYLHLFLCSAYAKIFNNLHLSEILNTLSLTN